MFFPFTYIRYKSSEFLGWSRNSAVEPRRVFAQEPGILPTLWDEAPSIHQEYVIMNNYHQLLILDPYYILYDYIHQSLLCIHIISPRRGL